MGQANVTLPRNNVFLASRNNVFVALGANAPLGARQPLEIVQSAIDLMRQIWGKLTSSHFYQTPAFPAGSGPDFINGACSFHSKSAPADILATLLEVESKFGRTRDLRWGERTLDLDLIAVGENVLPDRTTFAHWRDLAPDAQQTTTPDKLILPHPRLQDRPFVLVPLAEIAPDWIHPVLGQTVTQMLAAHSDVARAEIRPI